MKTHMKTKRPLHAILLLATLVTMTLQANVAYGEEEPVAPERSAKKQSEAVAAFDILNIISNILN